MYYQDQNGRKPYKYSTNNPKKGGEGTIYELTNGSEVIKVFHPGKEKAKEKKLKVMITMFQGLSSQEQSLVKQFCAWPTNFVYDDHGKFIGYSMPKVSGIELSSFLTPITRKRNGFRNDYLLRVYIAHNIAVSYTIIHQYFPDVCTGDVSKANILVENNGNIHLIDLDSIQINIPGNLFLSEVHTPGYTSPERIHNPKSVITQASDDFSLAILIFELLMNYEQSATHPFIFLKSNGEGSGISPDDAIIQGICLYVKSDSRYKLPDDARELDVILNTELIDCFVNTFDQGINDPSKRTTSKQWQIELMKFIQQIQNNVCSNNKEHVSLTGICPYCNKITVKKQKKQVTRKQQNVPRQTVINQTPVYQPVQQPVPNVVIPNNPYARLQQQSLQQSPLNNNPNQQPSNQGNNGSTEITQIIAIIGFIIGMAIAFCMSLV